MSKCRYASNVHLILDDYDNNIAAEEARKDVSNEFSSLHAEKLYEFYATVSDFPDKTGWNVRKFHSDSSILISMVLEKDVCFGFFCCIQTAMRTLVENVLR